MADRATNHRAECTVVIVRFGYAVVALVFHINDIQGKK